MQSYVIRVRAALASCDTGEIPANSLHFVGSSCCVKSSMILQFSYSPFTIPFVTPRPQIEIIMSSTELFNLSPAEVTALGTKCKAEYDDIMKRGKELEAAIEKPKEEDEGGVSTLHKNGGIDIQAKFGDIVFVSINLHFET